MPAKSRTIARRTNARRTATRRAAAIAARRERVPPQLRKSLSRETRDAIVKDARFQRDPNTRALMRLLDKEGRDGDLVDSIIDRSSRYTLGRTLGKGHYHQVVEVTDKKSGNRYAVRFPWREPPEGSYEPNPDAAVDGERVYRAAGLLVPDTLRGKHGVSVHELMDGAVDLQDNLGGMEQRIRDDPQFARQWLTSDALNTATGRFDVDQGRNMFVHEGRLGHYDLDLLFDDPALGTLPDPYLTEAAIQSVGGHDAARRIIDDAFDGADRTITNYGMSSQRRGYLHENFADMIHSDLYEVLREQKDYEKWTAQQPLVPA